MAHGAPFTEACETVRRRVVFTTHTPVPAGNETYAHEEFDASSRTCPSELGTDMESLLRLGRFDPANAHEPFGMTALAMRMSRSTNGVSRIHGDVSRRMWQGAVSRPLARTRCRSRHVTNGVHLPTWIAPPCVVCWTDYLRAGWHTRSGSPTPPPGTAVDEIPDRGAVGGPQEHASNRLVRWVQSKTVTDRLTRGDTMEYVDEGGQHLRSRAC